jgi:hypothetical protein
MPKHDTRVVVSRRLVEYAGEIQIHRRRHRVPLGRTIELHAQDASSLFGNDIIHGRILGSLVEFHGKSRYAAPAAPTILPR